MLLTILAYSNIFQNGFMIDDETFIVNWPQVKSMENLPQLLAGEVPKIHQGVYRPVRSILYLLYQRVWGENPFGYHLHGMVVHLLTTVLVYLIIREITKSKKVAFLGGLLFGLHPVHTESITYISASMEMTGVVFSLASFYLYLRSTKSFRVRTMIFSILLSLLALFTYEMTLTLPLLIVLYDLCFHPRGGKLRLKIYLSYFMGAGIFFVIRMAVLNIGAARGDYLGFSFYHTMLMMSKVMWKYIWLLISPINVSYIHDLASGFETFMTYHSNVSSILAQSLFDWDILAAVLGLIVLATIAVFCFKRRPVVTFCIAWFFITLIPVSYIFPQGIAMADKYLYTASFAFVLLLAVGLDWLITKKRFKEFGAGMAVLIAFGYIFLTYSINSSWKDPISFWSHLEQQHPTSALVAYTLGVTYGEQGYLDQAQQYYLKTIDLDPRFWEAYFNLGNIYQMRGQSNLAMEQYRQVLLINPEFEAARKNLEGLAK